MQDISDTSISAGRCAKEAGDQFLRCSAAPTTGLTRHLEPCFLHKLRSSVQSRSLTAGSPAGNSPVPCPGAVPSNNPTSKLRAIAAYSAGMQGAIANGSSSLETVVGTDPIPSLGQKMAQSQASWQPLPVGTWPLVASSAPSAAAYSMPTHHSRHQGLQTPSTPRPHAGCYQQHSKSHSHSEVSTVMQMESLQHESAIPGSEHISGITQTAHLASHTQLSDTTCPSNLDSRVVHLPPQHISQGGLQQPAPARSHTAQLLHQIDTDSVENMQQAGMHAAEAGLAGGRQPQASLESGILDNQHQQPQQQQPQQQQQSVRADISVLEWCSRADELLQLSAAPGEAAPMQAALPGSLQTGLTILPAYSGATFSLGPLIDHSRALVLRTVLVMTVKTNLMVVTLLGTVLVIGLSTFISRSQGCFPQIQWPFVTCICGYTIIDIN